VILTRKWTQKKIPADLWKKYGKKGHSFMAGTPQCPEI
jgi:hypothetical protein